MYVSHTESRGAMGAVPGGCLTAKERAVAQQVCQQQLPSVRGLGATDEERLIALDVAQRFPGVHACDIAAMPECQTMRMFPVTGGGGDSTIPRLRTATPTTSLPIPTVPGPNGPVAYEPEDGRMRSLAVGGLVLILVLGGGYAVYRGVKK